MCSWRSILSWALEQWSLPISLNPVSSDSDRSSGDNAQVLLAQPPGILMSGLGLSLWTKLIFERLKITAWFESEVMPTSPDLLIIYLTFSLRNKWLYPLKQNSLTHKTLYRTWTILATLSLCLNFGQSLQDLNVRDFHKICKLQCVEIWHPETVRQAGPNNILLCRCWKLERLYLTLFLYISNIVTKVKMHGRCHCSALCSLLSSVFWLCLVEIVRWSRPIICIFIGHIDWQLPPIHG